MEYCYERGVALLHSTSSSTVEIIVVPYPVISDFVKFLVISCIS